MPYCTISCYKYSQKNLNKYEEKIIKKEISFNQLETHFWIKINQTSHIHRLLHTGDFGDFWDFRDFRDFGDFEDFTVQPNQPYSSSAS